MKMKLCCIVNSEGNCRECGNTACANHSFKCDSCMGSGQSGLICNLHGSAIDCQGCEGPQCVQCMEGEYCKFCAEVEAED